VRQPAALLAAAILAALTLLGLVVAPLEANGQEAGTVRQVPWELQQRFVKPTAHSLRITIFGGVCGQGPDRLDHADVRITRKRIWISAFLYSPPPKGDVCPALAIVIPATVKLPAPVRHRSIFDTADGGRRWPTPG
jgi:hypothetical protein